MKISRNSLAVSFTALACAGVIGGVTAISLVGQQPSKGETVVRSVSGEGGAEASPSAQASAGATAAPSASAAAPQSTTSTSTGSQTVTEPNPTTEPAPVEPAPEPPIAPPANSGGESGPPVGNGPPTGPTEYPCLPQEYGINPRCPLPAPTN